MSRRHRLLAVVAGIGTIAGILAACTDLGGLSGAGDDASVSDSPAADAPVDTSLVATDSSSDAGALDAQNVDAATRSDATVKIDASGCTTCDCDGDRAARVDVDCGATSSAPDCDDTDPLIFPGQGFVGDTWSSAHVPAGDWNCDGLTQKAYPTNVSCTSSAGNCNTPAGFTGDPACGTMGTFVTCKVSGLLNCAVDTSMMKLQACK